MESAKASGMTVTTFGFAMCCHLRKQENLSEDQRKGVPRFAISEAKTLL